MKQLDLHGHELDEAVLEILAAAKECLLDGEPALEVVHGYSHGAVIKAYLATPKFKAALKREGFLLDKICSTKGSTTFRIASLTLTNTLKEAQRSSNPVSVTDGPCPGCGKPGPRCTCKYCPACGERIAGGKCGCPDPEHAKQ